MDWRSFLALVTLLAIAAVGIAADRPAAPATRPDNPAANWPQFRGPAPDGSAPDGGDPPVQIDLARDLRFKTALAAKGNSSPIIWGERIYLTGEGERVLAFDRASGRRVWDTRLQVPAPVSMPGDEDVEPPSDDTGTASPTPCTDGKRVYAFFGSGVLGCVDVSGKQVWAARLVPGKPRSTFGLAASPVLVGDLVIQVVDQGKEPEDALSFITALRAADGVEAWRKDRPVRSSWTTPLLVRVGKAEQLVTSAAPLAIGYDPTLGLELWRLDGLSGDVAACPIFCGKSILLLSGEGGDLFAVKPDGEGDITKTGVLWQKKIPLPDVASPVCDSKRYYHVSSGGDLYCLNLADGAELWKKELKGTYWASPVLAGGRIYLVNTDGLMTVASAADGKVLGETKLGEKIVATLAILDGRIYIRTEKNLLCIGRP